MPLSLKPQDARCMAASKEGFSPNPEDVFLYVCVSKLGKNYICTYNYNYTNYITYHNLRTHTYMHTCKPTAKIHTHISGTPGPCNYSPSQKRHNSSHSTHASNALAEGSQKPKQENGKIRCQEALALQNRNTDKTI